jgi:CheY-like chemotaxis protein
MTKPLALVFYEALLPGTQLVNRLQDLGYLVHTHTDAASLVEIVRELKPFVMIVDLAGPNSDLCPAIRELRGSQETQHIPVLAFAKDGQEELRAAAREAGATLVAGDTAVLTHLPELLEQVLNIEQ